MATTIKINKSKLFDNFFEESNNRKVKYLVLHHIQDQSLECAINELKKHQVSSHYIIDDNGDIHQLVKEKDIAYHAGFSYWNGQFGLNKESIGIEFFSKDPYKIGFSQKQIESGIKLCQNIIKNHKIEPKNIVAHSDIAFFGENDPKFDENSPKNGKNNKNKGFLNRKDDPSELFPWELFAQNGVGIYPKNIKNEENTNLSFKIGDNSPEIAKIKQKLVNFGYKLDNLDKNFDKEFENLTIVFNRRFNKNQYLENKALWTNASSNSLEVLI